MRTYVAMVCGALAVVGTTPSLSAHDEERTRVVLSFSPDGSFALEISHDPNWLLLRLESFAGGSVPPRITAEARDIRLEALGAVLIDRIVLWVDGREVRPDAVEYLPGQGMFRLRGRMPQQSQRLRWLYGSVGDTYPLIVQRADGRTQVEMIEGSNWSGPLDIGGQFRANRAATVNQIAMLVALFGVGLLCRFRSKRTTTGAPRLSSRERSAE